MSANQPMTENKGQDRPDGVPGAASSQLSLPDSSNTSHQNEEHSKTAENNYKSSKTKEDPRQQEINIILSKDEKDYEGILGVERSAPHKKKMRAYKQRMLRVHPDKNMDKVDDGRKAQVKEACRRTFHR